MNQQRFDVLLDSVGRLVRRGAIANALNIAEKLRPVEAANILRYLVERDREALFAGLSRRDPSKAAEALSELGPQYVQELLGPLEIEQIKRLFEHMSSDDVALLIAELDEDVRDHVLDRMHDDQSTDVQGLLTFEDETAGRIMSPDYCALNEDLTVSESIAALQKRSEDFEMSFYVYVTDVRNHLIGVISLRQLLLHTPSTPLKKIMTTDVIKVSTSTDQEEVARLVAFYNLIALPVVDVENRIVGIITVDDIIDVIREEATEDIYALAGVEAEDRALGSAINSVRRRLPWLLLSLIPALLAAAIAHIYRESLQACIPLAILIPVVLTVGSNAATQAMTVIVRGIGLNELTWDRIGWVLLKEGAVGLASGAVVGIVSGAVALIWFQSLALAAVLAIGIVLITVLACLSGTIIPMGLRKFQVDPAVASSIFVVTLTIVVGLLLYFAIGKVFLGSGPN